MYGNVKLENVFFIDYLNFVLSSLPFYQSFFVSLVFVFIFILFYFFPFFLPWT